MSFLSSSKKVTLVTGKAALKVGAKVAVQSGKLAGKGSYWVLRKAAVDPFAMKINSSKILNKYSDIQKRINVSECAVCGKKLKSKKNHFCTVDCGILMAQQFESLNEYEKKKFPDPTPSDGLYLDCGCNRRSTFHGRDCGYTLTNERIKENVRYQYGESPDEKVEEPKRNGVHPKLAERARQIANEQPKKGWW